jgi:hypothetical protein
MYKNNSLKKTLIVLSFTALLILVGYYFMFRDIKQKNQHTFSLRNELTHESSKEEYVASTKKTLEDLAPELTKVNNSIVATGGDVEFIEGLENLAHENGIDLTIDSLSLEDDVKFITTGVNILNIKAETSGGWKGTYKLMSQLESLPFKIRIKSFTIKSTGSNPNVDIKKTPLENIWQTNFEISVLKYK